MISLYKASAGSGKTFQLTRQYLILLLSYKHPDTGVLHLRPETAHNCHRNILAITFTNKATDEMKRRIIHELAVLAQRERGWDGESPYLEDFCKLFSCTPGKLRQAASRALDDLLNDFGSFNVSTIDAFFQTILRTFAREAELTGNYELEIDESYAVNEGVTQLLNELSRQSPEDSRQSHAMSRMIRYMKTQAVSGNSFNVFNKKGVLFSTMVKLFNGMLGEDFDINAKALNEYLKDDTRLEQFCKAIEEKLNTLKLNAYRTACEFFRRYDESSEIFKVSALTAIRHTYNKNWRGLYKWGVSALAEQCLDDPSAAFKKNKSSDTLLEFFEAHSAAMKLKNDGIFYEIILDNIYQLGMLSDIMGYVNKYCVDNNLLLLGDTNGLLNRIIGDDDVPFIYERVGVWIDHYLIDEFQDTSRMQWQNLRPLVAQSTSSANDNLIIGDEKQCIYRFRNSDPSLIHSQVQADFPTDSTVVGDNIAGNTNWRSTADVVRFNNTFFTFLARMLDFADTYGNVAQQVAPKNLDKRGFVQFTSLESDNVGDFRDQALPLMMQHIKRQLAAGYCGGDIAVLVYSRADGAKVIEHILDAIRNAPDEYPGLKVVSDDSMYVNTAPSVRFLISMLRFIVANDVTAKRSVSQRRIAAMVNQYELLRLQNDGVATPELLAEAVELATNTTDPKVLGDRFDKLRNLSLISMVEMIATEYLSPRIREEENMYISAFEDIVSDYCERGEGDVQGFLKWWDSTGCRSQVSAPEDENAIRVMTIHKSKGLEFPCVIIPLASWAVSKNEDVEWFIPCGFDGIDPNIIPPLIPLKLNSNMDTTPLADQYQAIKREEAMDKLNMAYVAFTRAVNELIVIYDPQRGVGAQINSGLGIMMNPSRVAELWDELKADLPGSESVFCTPEVTAEDNMEVYTVGAPTVSPEREKKQLTVLDPTDSSPMPVYKAADRFDIWAQIDIDRDNWLSAAVERGKMYHRILQDVRRPDDIPYAARRLASRGIIPRDEVEDIVDKLTRLVADENVAHWFNGYKRVINERPILMGGKTIRPDRMVFYPDGSVQVVDYKTGERRASYASQVRSYVEALRAAGYNNVSGYLWYLDSHKVEAV